MSRIKRIPAIFVAALVVGMLAASPAGAAGSWFVNGVKLPVGSKVALAATTRVTEAVVFNVPSLNIKFSCSGANRKEPEIIGTTVAKATSLIFTGCSEIAPAKCSVESEVLTEPVQGEPFFTTAKLKVLFTPQSGTKLATINFLGAECSISGEKVAKGKLVGNASMNQTELTEQVLEALGTTENNSFEITGSKVYLERGKSFAKLASSEKWSFQE
jgi:hypothetical protein